jgi:hypothetical protein
MNELRRQTERNMPTSAALKIQSNIPKLTKGSPTLIPPARLRFVTSMMAKSVIIIVIMPVHSSRPTMWPMRRSRRIMKPNIAANTNIVPIPANQPKLPMIAVST